MEYRAVGNRCAVNLDDLELPINYLKALRILIQRGFIIREMNITHLASSCVGPSIYERGAKPSEAPLTVDCSSFVKWIYGQCGIWLPRRPIQQYEHGQPISQQKLIEGDLIFTEGHINYYRKDPSEGIGHVGIVTDRETVIHAANRRLGVIENSLEEFLTTHILRGTRRYITNRSKTLSLESPPDRLVEISDDFRWIILQSLPKE